MFNREGFKGFKTLEYEDLTEGEKETLDDMNRNGDKYHWELWFDKVILRPNEWTNPFTDSIPSED